MSGEMDFRKNAEEATAASPEMCEDAPSGSAWGKTPCEGIAADETASRSVCAMAASPKTRENAPGGDARRKTPCGGTTADETASPSARAMAASPKTRENAPGGSARKDSPPSRSASREAAALLSMRPGETDAASSEARRDLSGDRAGEKSLVEPAASSAQFAEAAALAAPEVLLRPGERLDDLQWGGLRLIQRPDAFRFGTDSVLLADFAAPKRTDRAADLGCGTGAIATLMAAHCPGLRVDAVEIQPEIADMARRSVALNHMEEQICVREGDLRDCWRALGAQSRTLVVCNPPYGRDGSALTSRSETTRIARHEGGLSPEELARAAARLLRSGGRFCVVYPAPRIYEMMRAMDDCRLAPKRIRTVHSVAGRAPKLVLLDAVKDGGSQLHWLEPLVLRGADGEYTDEWRRIYRVGAERGNG